MRWVESAVDLVMADLTDALIQENLFSFAEGTGGGAPRVAADTGLRLGESWYHVELTRGRISLRVRSSGELQPVRYSREPLWHKGGDGETRRVLDPDHLMELLLADARAGGEEELHGGEGAVADLRSAVQHASVTLREFHQLPDPAPAPGGVHAGERLAATRDRPFHPTARASSGWSAAEHSYYGPMRARPMATEWVAVRRDRLKLGEGVESDRLHESVLDDAGRRRITDMLERAGADLQDYQPLPVHPWQSEHVLRSRFREEMRSGAVIPLDGQAGAFLPTASLRSFVTVPEGPRHLKLPLGVSTLGAARLLPPRYLDNSDRAQRTMRSILERNTELNRLTSLCDESVWAGWQLPSGTDEFEERPGHLAAQVRVLPQGLLDEPGTLVLPMGALCAHEWDVLHKALAPLRPHTTDRAEFALSLFTDVADAFCRMGMGFLQYGVLPELHGQNVLVSIGENGIGGFVLRDHDALRLFPEWMAAAGVRDPGYRLKPGGTQSLSLPTPEALVGYLQTLGFQVNLYGIISALAAWSGTEETVFWQRLRGSVESALEDLVLPARVHSVIERELLLSATWPSRQVLGPLIRRAPKGEVSMPAATGLVPNPLTKGGRST